MRILTVTWSRWNALGKWRDPIQNIFIEGRTQHFRVVPAGNFYEELIRGVHLAKRRSWIFDPQGQRTHTKQTYIHSNCECLSGHGLLQQLTHATPLFWTLGVHYRSVYMKCYRGDDRLWVSLPRHMTSWTAFSSPRAINELSAHNGQCATRQWREVCIQARFNVHEIISWSLRSSVLGPRWLPYQALNSELCNIPPLSSTHSH